MLRAMKALPILLFISLLLASCGGGGGSSSSSSSGVATDNTKASGTFRYILLIGGSPLSIQIGTATLDGAGGGSATRTSPSVEVQPPITYVAKVDNSIYLDDFVGTIRSGGNFIAFSNTTNGEEMIMFMVKNSSLSDTANTYRFSQFSKNTSDPYSETMIYDIETAQPSPGFLTWTSVAPTPLMSGTEDYTYNNLSGTYVIDTTLGEEAYGAITPDNEINIFANATTTGTQLYGAVGLQYPGSGLSVADLSGTYIVHQFMDEDTTVTGSFMTVRSKVVLDGAGSGTYATLATSTGDNDSGSFTYTVSTEGAIALTVGAETIDGFTLADGSVFILTDHDVSNDSVDIQVGIKQ